MFAPNETVLDSRTAERVIIEQPLSDNEYVVRRVSDNARQLVSGGGLMRESGGPRPADVITKSGAGGGPDQGSPDQEPVAAGDDETEVTPETTGDSDPSDDQSEPLGADNADVSDPNRDKDTGHQSGSGAGGDPRTDASEGDKSDQVESGAAVGDTANANRPTE